MKSARLVLTIPPATETGHCFAECPLFRMRATRKFVVNEFPTTVIDIWCVLHYDTPSYRPSVRCPLRRKK